ncbi:amino acid ABC transporter permease [Gemmobacter fulvus]|uniref:Amino acid ABC transporter permease n=1 Tax=Gemmobacter fulvus TaxID=2840474 RepID=A0A975P4M2_9RHOB|nr:amino acid ABC transporter permease [Gemmobacter fulvus]MBT9245528.1 amino acid ABC transporter permease [Gemmobacter fulvus]QWK89610.1 amino acid ABC transporter permease [Gemmobacter fulvus]
MQEHISYVRSQMLPPLDPPAGEKGAVKWLRENLFSGPLNSVLTILGLLALYWVLSNALPWLLHSVWNANSLGECRQIIAERWGEGATGACWAMVKARWHQYIFGFYPQYLYWRPTLAFCLLFVALAPVLYTALPRKMLWFTALYPALMFWLLWGGSVWAPVMAMAGFGVMAVVFKLVSARFGVIIGASAGFVAAVLWWLLASGPVTAALQGAIPLGIESVDSDQFGGFLLSIVIGITAISASLPMGILLALGRRSDMLLVRTLSVGFIEFIRGVPLITLLFTASLLLQYFLPPGNDFDIILRVIILVTLFAAAYIAEVIRGGLAALPRGQYEAGDALGLDYWQAQRLIVMPQALKISIPGIVSSFIGLFKDTTLVAFVGLNDPLKGITQIVRADINWKGIYWEPYLFAGALFFLICFGMSRYSMWLERKLKTDHR